MRLFFVYTTDNEITNDLWILGWPSPESPWIPHGTALDLLLLSSKIIATSHIYIDFERLSIYVVQLVMTVETSGEHNLFLRCCIIWEYREHRMLLAINKCVESDASVDISIILILVHRPIKKVSITHETICCLAASDTSWKSWTQYVSSGGEKIAAMNRIQLWRSPWAPKSSSKPTRVDRGTGVGLESNRLTSLLLSSFLLFNNSVPIQFVLSNYLATFALKSELFEEMPAKSALVRLSFLFVPSDN